MDKKIEKEGLLLSMSGEFISFLEEIKSNLIAVGSHRIRTLLNIEIGFIDALKDECKSKKTAEYLNMMERVGQDIIKAVEFLLSIYNIEKDILIDEEKDFDPIVELDVSNYFKEKNINLRFDKSIKPIKGDVSKIKYMLLSIVGAASKLSNSPIDALIKIEDGYLVCNVNFEVEKKMRDIIINFFKEKDKLNFDGLDNKMKIVLFSLALTQKIADMLGGNFSFNEMGENGLTLSFSSPVRKAEGKLKKKEISLKDKEILIAEDNKANQMVMSILFNKAGIKFDLANNGEEAVELFKKKRYDVVLMDVSMPVMDGLEATRKIREYEKENNLGHTPIIALTAHAMRGEREKILDAGMDEYITKPVEKKKLFSTIENLLLKNL